MTPEQVTNTMFRHHMREASLSAEHAFAASQHMQSYHAQNATKHFMQALSAIGFSLVRTEDVIAAAKIVEKADA